MNKENINEITSRMAEIIKEKGYGTSEGSYTKDIAINPVAVELDGLQEKLTETIDRRFSGTAEGQELDIIVADDGIYREEAENSTGSVLITGVNGAEIKKGYIVLRADGISYTILEEKLITNIETHVSVECSTPGITGNCGIGEINRFAESYPGLASVTNEEELSDGKDEESDESLLARRNDRISHPATSWNQWWFRDEALKVDGVGLANAIPRHNGAGTVKVIITDRDISSASSELIQEVFDYLDSQFLNDITITVETISKKTINLNIEGTLNADFDIEAAKSSISEDLNAYYKAALFKADKLYYSYIQEVLMHSDALYRVSSLKVNDLKDNIDLLDNELGETMEINITINGV
jgi:uncharacterized phage protein gp47/JayE